MRKLIWMILAALLMTVAGIPAQEVDTRVRGQIDQEHTNWLDHVLRSISTIKPGMTRKDLFTILTEEGGISTRTRKTYVYKDCPYIKVDVEFSPADNDANPDALAENSEDKILKMSRPYLEYSHMD
jgi:hypothetical protein